MLLIDTLNKYKYLISYVLYKLKPLYSFERLLII